MFLPHCAKQCWGLMSWHHSQKHRSCFNRKGCRPFVLILPVIYPTLLALHVSTIRDI